MEQVRVVLRASDPLSYEGLLSYLQSRSEFTVVDPADQAEATVFVVSCDQLTADVVALLRRSAAELAVPVVLVVSEITEAELLIAVECRVVAVLPRVAVTADRLAHSVLAAANGGGVLPPNLVGELLKHVERLHREVLTPNGLNAAGLTSREIDVLRLMANGFDTHEIADELCYSERTVKNVIYGVTHRLKLRNRAHAVAYALRTGMI
ncbi:helix-turn-helix transcriptional regulator [Salinispora arenicola]|uniref:DNA-binding NarL/FixJ family response regulator n=1 Tax=Salinispora arenicola TaxID=168697 RepID=A0A542XKT0_SALAC|nr:response regulator transcription factor [Salinispora arenicola]MCN0151719.1 response regulator transcription factor [Salinispora arenicola]MCN0179549.1 response regulator transcription factor [Salinispora arenicola]NIL42679.1 response regulator transcription factor [Salinispora arenicola]TQL36462.1 DNA-binding NarL/FixJ family response regulator [Salinispora arenicola]GIM87392.1 helix-turn-helix transcriptional regulator [Salinispora arenicola]